MKPVRLMLMVLLVSTTWAAAQDGPWGGEGRRRGWGYRRGGMERFEQPTEQEWEALATFMKEISPKRWEIFENLPENSMVRDRTRTLFLSRYRMLVNTKQNDPALYETLVERVKVEDTIFSTVANMKQLIADNASKAQIDSAREQFQAKVGELVDLGIKERRQRIEKMERTLQTERQKLREDEQNRDALIARRMKNFEQGNEWQRPGERQQGQGDRDEQHPAERANMQAEQNVEAQAPR